MKNEENNKIISWFDLREEEKNKLIKEFESKNKGFTTVTLHRINVIMLITSLLIALFGWTIISTDDQFVAILLIIKIFVVIYILNTIKIYKINKNFKNWLTTKNIIK